MSETIFLGITIGSTDTRILLNDDETTLLEARLSPSPSHPRALQWLLEAIALWEGRPVRAVLSVGAQDECGAQLLRDCFTDFGGPLYAIEWADSARPPRRRDDIRGAEDFPALEQLQLFDALQGGR
jgi:hypothetical protein